MSASANANANTSELTTVDVSFGNLLKSKRYLIYLVPTVPLLLLAKVMQINGCPVAY